MPQLISKTKGIRVPHALRPWLCSGFFFFTSLRRSEVQELVFSFFLVFVDLTLFVSWKENCLKRRLACPSSCFQYFPILKFHYLNSVSQCSFYTDT